MLSVAAPQESATWRSPAVAVSPGGALGGVVSTTIGATGVAVTGALCAEVLPAASTAATR